MANQQMRLGWARLPGGSNYGLSKYRPVPDWGAFGNSDYPTVKRIFRTTTSGSQTSIKLIDRAEQYQMETGSNYNGWSVSNEDWLWYYEPSQVNRPEIGSDTNRRAMIIGHKGPVSSNSAVQSWQRGVIGFQMQHNMLPYSGQYGNYIDEATILYRKWSDTTKFYGIRLISGGFDETNVIKGNDSTGPFYQSSPRRDGTSGGFYIAMRSNHSAYNTVREDKYVFQGLYLKWGLYDNPSQFQSKLQLWGLRLIFDSTGSSDTGKRIVHPCMWSFQDAGQSNNLKLTP
jgi:hypothetical protein